LLARQPLEGDVTRCQQPVLVVRTQIERHLQPVSRPHLEWGIFAAGPRWPKGYRDDPGWILEPWGWLISSSRRNVDNVMGVTRLIGSLFQTLQNYAKFRHLSQRSTVHLLLPTPSGSDGCDLSPKGCLVVVACPPRGFSSSIPTSLNFHTRPDLKEEACTFLLCLVKLFVCENCMSS